jgi:hypothetical protein
MVDQVIPTLISQSSAFNVTGSLTVSNINVSVGTTVPVGMFSPSTNTLSLVTNGAQAVTIDSSSNFSIGTTSVFGQLAGRTSLSVSGASEALIGLGAGSTVSSIWRFDGTNSFLYAQTGQLTVQTVAAQPLLFRTSNTEAMRITALGNVGIGTTTVTAGNAVAVFGGNLQVGTTGNGLKFADGTYQSTAYTGAVAASGTLIRAPQVLTSGTSYTTPAGCNHILIEMIGGGGGGGGCPGTSSGVSYGGGGGSSVFAVKYATVTPLTAYTYAIGGLGAGAGGGGNGSAGGTTSITISGVTYSCSGGGGGLAGSSGVGGAVGAVGVATNMDYAITNLNNANAYQGGCVTMPYGINLGGFNITGPSQITSGANGYGFGAGGGGAYNSSYSGAGAQSGGNGYQGMIRIWEYT